MTYHIGLVKRGRTLLIEVADTVDQLSCETWKYLGERETTIAKLRENASLLCLHVNEEHGTSFACARVSRIAGDDFTAGHEDTARREIAQLGTLTRYAT
jgi:hypothetical protein